MLFGEEGRLMNSFYQSLNTPKAAFLQPLFVVIGSYLAYVILILFALRILKIKDIKQRFYFVFLSTLSVIISWGVIASAMKMAWYLPRPFVYFNFSPMAGHEIDSGMPSNHMAFFIPLAIVIWELDKKWGSIIIAMTVLMGSGRIFMGLHWPTDILAGILVGVIGYIAAKWLLPKKVLHPVKE